MRLKIFKIGHVLDDRGSSHFRRKKPGELWSGNIGHLKVKSYLPKSTFSGDHFLAFMGCCTSEFLYKLENDQVLLAHPPQVIGVLVLIFLQ